MYSNYNVQHNGNVKRITLYIAVCVAALFVAVLSGTFAYFTASVSNNNVVTGTIADVGITLTVEKMTSSSGTATNGATLIPFNLISSSGSFTSSSLTNSTTGAIPNGCIDSNGYTVCDVFKISAKAGNDIDVNGYIKIGPGASTYDVTNVKWLLLGPKTSTNASKIENITSSVYNSSYLTASNIKSSITYANYNSSSVYGDVFTNSGTDGHLNTSLVYYYVIVWLEDIEDAQDDNGTYKGTVTFRGKGSTEGQITASFG